MKEDLFPNQEPRWTVLTCYHHQSKVERAAKAPLIVSHYELLYGTHIEARRKGEAGQESLREMARFLNRRTLVPRPKIQCAADAPNPEKYLQKITP